MGVLFVLYCVFVMRTGHKATFICWHKFGSYHKPENTSGLKIWTYCEFPTRSNIVDYMILTRILYYNLNLLNPRLLNFICSLIKYSFVRYRSYYETTHYELLQFTLFSVKILFVMWSSVLVQIVCLSDRFTISSHRPPFAASRKYCGSSTNGFGVRLQERTSKLRMTVARPAFTCISANRKPGTIKISGLNIWIKRAKGV